MHDLGTMHEFYGMENGKKPGDIVHTSEPKAGGLKKKDFLVFLAFLLLTEGGGAIIGISTADQINTWWVSQAVSESVGESISESVSELVGESISESVRSQLLSYLGSYLVSQ